MAIHDEYARVTPFEVAFPDQDTADRWTTRIRERAEAGSTEDALRDPGRFLALPAVAEVVHEMREPGAGTGEVQKHGILLFHAFHFQEADRPLYLLRTGVARYLVETRGDEESGEGGDSGRPELPERAGYLQLPRQLFWMAPSEEGPPEPVDGLFWAAPDGDRLSLLVIGGMREDRPGFSVVPLPPVPLDDAGAWIRARVREAGSDFETTLPGGELDRLYSFEAAGEVLKLVARTFRYVEEHPRAVYRQDESPAAPETVEEAGTDGRSGPRPTGLPYRGIHLEDRAEDGEESPDAGGASTGSEKTREGT